MSQRNAILFNQYDFIFSNMMQPRSDMVQQSRDILQQL